ncbi:c-type cytochrome [Fulvivirga sp.]|uniref:c-type cytochrome n=1 Tax=Fulvivirga sp. TaxID=1931237 RepID=UPI0032EE0C38
MKQKIKILINSLFVIISIIQVGCNSTNGQKAEITSDNITGSESSEVSNLLSVNCYACHNPNTNSHDEILAPPLAGIKMRYINATNDKEDFINRMSGFIFTPNAEAALMKGPVKRFGLMPKTALNEDEIRKIVTYIYENEIEEPSWFKEHEKEMHGGKNNNKN